jgi:hypothetical protein
VFAKTIDYLQSTLLICCLCISGSALLMAHPLIDIKAGDESPDDRVQSREGFGRFALRLQSLLANFSGV